MHVYNRGARGMNIVKDKADKWRFIKSLYLLNDTYKDENWHRDTAELPLFERPQHWPERKPLVSILAYTLMPNHFHLVLKEIEEGGIAKFMQRLGGSMTLCFNLKHKGQGSIFQGSYKSRTVGKDIYLRYLSAYVLVKNVFELYPGGLQKALQNFDTAWDWAMAYEFSSLGVTAGKAHSPILDNSLILNLDLAPSKKFKSDAKDMFFGHVSIKDSLKQSILETW